MSRKRETLPRAEVVARLLEFRERAGEIPADIIAEWGRRADRDPKTIRRWLAEAEAPERKKKEPGLTREQLLEIAAKGSLKPAWTALGKKAGTGASFTTFWRRFQSMPPAVREGVLHGVRHMSDVELYTRYEAERRNDVWQIDHTGVPMWVTVHGVPHKLMMTDTIDDRCRFVPAVVLTVGTPNAEGIAWCLAGGMRRRLTDTGIEVGGIPGRLRHDHGRDYLGELIGEAARRAMVVVDPVTPYAGWEKGKVERWHRTIKEMFFRQLPGYTEGALDVANRHYAVPPDGELLPIEAVIAKLNIWLRWYNLEKPHEGLDGRTPIEAWAEDDTPLRFPTDELLHRLVLRHGTRIVQKDGVHHEGRIYNHVALARYVRRKVTVGYFQDDPDRLEVFDAETDEWICTATSIGDASLASALRRNRRKDRRLVDGIQREAAERNRMAAALADGERPTTIEPPPALDAPLRADPQGLIALLEGLQEDTDGNR